MSHTLFGRTNGRYVRFVIQDSTLDASSECRTWDEYAKWSGADLLWDSFPDPKSKKIEPKKLSRFRRVKNAVNRTIVRRKKR